MARGVDGTMGAVEGHGERIWARILRELNMWF
jgi:hypothetical protein